MYCAFEADLDLRTSQVSLRKATSLSGSMVKSGFQNEMATLPEPPEPLRTQAFLAKTQRFLKVVRLLFGVARSPIRIKNPSAPL